MTGSFPTLNPWLSLKEGIVLPFPLLPTILKRNRRLVIIPLRSLVKFPQRPLPKEGLLSENRCAVLSHLPWAVRM